MFKVKKIPQLLKGNFFLYVQFHDVPKLVFEENEEKQIKRKRRRKRTKDRQKYKQTVTLFWTLSMIKTTVFLKE
jgi:hypothetical protein